MTYFEALLVFTHQSFDFLKRFFGFSYYRHDFFSCFLKLIVDQIKIIPQYMARQVLFSLFEISTYCDQFLSDYEYNSLWNKNYKIADRLSSYCLYNAIFNLKYHLLN